MDLRVVTIDVARQEVMTRDNVPMTVDAVVYFRVIDPASAVVRVENYLKATSLISQTTLRSVLGQAELDDFCATDRPATALLTDNEGNRCEQSGIVHFPEEMA
jgi:regulator of protease activity HflC (stomatin/prohibitin superfamily)